MSTKTLLLALAAACTASAKVFTDYASKADGGDVTGAAPAPRAAVPTGTPAGKKPAPGGKGGGKKAAPTVDFDTLKSNFLSLVKEYENGKDLATAVLDRFGLKKLNEASEDQYAEINTYVDAVKSGDENPLDSGTNSDDEDLLG